MPTKRNKSPASRTPTAAILRLGRRSGVLRPRDLARQNIPRIYLRRMVLSGLLVKHGRGLYGLPDAEVTEHHSLAQAGKRVPHGVICLLSALSYHGLTTQTPREVWIAVDRAARAPLVKAPRLRIVRFSGDALRQAIEKKVIEGVSVQIYGVAKTVADAYKYRHKIGIDVAIEALRDAWERKKCTMDDLARAAKICRVGRIMQPHMEMLG
jgi:predicted transcriptional regulator of viral defense system